jgi:hypothetical protein
VLVGRAEMKIVAVATTLILTAAGGALLEAADLPKPASVMGGNSQNVQMHPFVSKTTKYSSPEYGMRKDNLRSMPLRIHPYVSGKTRF